MRVSDIFQYNTF